MSSSQAHPSPPSCATLLQSFVQIDGLPFAAVLTEAHCQELFQRQGLAWDPTPADGAAPAAPPDPASAVAVPVVPVPCAAELTPAADRAPCRRPATDTQASTSAAAAALPATGDAAGEHRATTAPRAVPRAEVSGDNAAATGP